MPRSTSIPSYRLHKPTGQAVVTVQTSGGGRLNVFLGKSNPQKSRLYYSRIIAEMAASPAAAPVMVVVKTT